MMDSGLLKVNEASSMLGISPYTLRNWVSQKKIPYVKLGKAVRFKKSDIENFIDKNRIIEISANDISNKN